jgi:hypothetical protein
MSVFLEIDNLFSTQRNNCFPLKELMTIVFDYFYDV